ncbi:hypothetical protein Avbf_15553 [Armadillidium vulgare]|nr:hypothetical protein Avbf_15553 [Armadillidium vulgare]
MRKIYPIFFIVVPEWFKKRYALAYRNLRENTLKFLTPFDIHETLLDIVHERYNDSSYYSEEQPQSIRSISLFKKLPMNRTCKDVGVPLTFCACQGYVFIKTNSSLEKKILNILKDF